MQTRELLTDAYTRIAELYAEVAVGLDDIGYGHDDAQVDAVRIGSPDLLIGYHAEVHGAMLDYLSGVDADELDRVVDRRWDPPVTAGVRLVSIEGDCLQHLGQAAYVRGLLGLGVPDQD